MSQPRVFFFIAFVIMFTPISYSASPLKIVGLDVEPYFISSEKGRLSGIFYDGLMAAANKANINIEIKTLPWGWLKYR